jgi:hypothetical protein
MKMKYLKDDDNSFVYEDSGFSLPAVDAVKYRPKNPFESKRVDPVQREKKILEYQDLISKGLPTPITFGD